MKTHAAFHAHEKAFAQLHAEWGVLDSRGIELMRLLNASARMFEVIADHYLQEHDLSVPRLRLLLWLYAADHHGNKEGLSPSRLSEFQHISKNTVSSLLDSLEKQGLVERALNPDDKRKFNIRISRTGRELLRKTLPAHGACLTHAVAGLTHEEQTALLKLLRKLRQTLAEQVVSHK
ncbi:MAG: MarR family transcriptional regulator [Chloroflexi bacterium]|nr:MarR family transcriptional regulator [Chloroflexota bacterium]